MRRSVKLNVLGLALIMAGCSITPDYHRPEMVKPGQWKNEIIPQQLSGSSLISTTWWKSFGSAELDRLIAEGLNNNLDLATARERIRQARASAKIAGAPLLPALSATGSYDFRDSNRPGSSNVFGNQNSTNSRISTSKNTWQGQWNLSYEVDLWGGIRAGHDSAKGLLRSTQLTFDALQLTVMGDVAQAYFAIVGLKERKRVAEANLTNIADVMAIINARLAVGAVSMLEVAQQKSELANAEAAVAQLDQQIAQSENALAVLLGRVPQQFKVGDDKLTGLRIPKAAVGSATALLDRRPDIRSAEMQLAVAQADITKARVAFYPRLQLGADNIFTAATTSQPTGIAIALAASLTSPIFQGGRLEGELGRTLARRTELLENYRKTLLVAYQEVEDALALGNQATRRHEQLQVAVENANEAYWLARERYLAGATDYQTLLIVQRSLFSAQDREIQAHVDELTASVLLFKSLGGGWSEQY